MRVDRTQWQEIQDHFMVFVLAFCMVVGGYGIFTAPDSKKASDQFMLEQELENNVKALQRMELIDMEPEEGAFLQSSAAGGPPSGNKRQSTYKPVSVIGDSVFLGAAISFKKVYKNAVIDAKISRQVVQGLDVAKQMKKKGKLKKFTPFKKGKKQPDKTYKAKKHRKTEIHRRYEQREKYKHRKKYKK